MVAEVAVKPDAQAGALEAVQAPKLEVPNIQPIRPEVSIANDAEDVLHKEGANAAIKEFVKPDSDEGIAKITNLGSYSSAEKDTTAMVPSSSENSKPDSNADGNALPTNETTTENSVVVLNDGTPILNSAIKEQTMQKLLTEKDQLTKQMGSLTMDQNSRLNYLNSELDLLNKANFPDIRPQEESHNSSESTPNTQQVTESFQKESSNQDTEGVTNNSQDTQPEQQNGVQDSSVTQEPQQNEDKIFGTLNNDNSGSKPEVSDVVKDAAAEGRDVTPINLSNDNTGEVTNQREANSAYSRQAEAVKDANENKSQTATENQPKTKEEVDAEMHKLQTEKDGIMKQLEDGKMLSTEQAKRLNEINGRLSKDPQELYKQAKEIAANGGQLTKEQMDALTGENIPDVENTTPEEALEKARKDVEDLGVKALMDLEAGNGSAEESFIAWKKKFGEYMGMNMSQGYEQQARKFMQEVMNPEKAGNPRETAKMRAVREKLQELARLELQKRSLAETIKKMNNEEKNLKDEVNRAEMDYVNERNPDEKQKKLLQFSGMSMRLSQYQESINVQKGLGRDLIIKERQTRGFIHRKLGTHNVGYNLLFGAGTAIAQAGLYAESAVDSVFAFA